MSKISILLIWALVIILSSACAYAIPNPAAVYCTELGYEYKIINEPEGQKGICIFPDATECEEWQFLTGKCGKKFSFCAKQGHDLVVKTDGQNPYSKDYAVCVDNGKKIGAVTDLSDLAQKAKKVIIHKKQSASSAVLMNGLPSSFDWRNNNGNWMTTVKDQGICGSCWAFSSVGTVEAVYNILDNNPDLDFNFAEQYLVSDCSNAGDCCSGFHRSALGFIRDYGIPTENCMPYVDGYAEYGCSCSDGTCDNNCNYRTEGRCSDRTCSDNQCNPDDLYTIYDYDKISSQQHLIKQKIVEDGPLSVSLDITSGYWDGDIYRCGAIVQRNHAVIIAGYDDIGEYWIVKNSWGSGWNGDGYFKVGYGECDIEKVAYCACENIDFDGDYIPNDEDSCTDSDNDGYGNPGYPANICLDDNCPETYNPGQEDLDGDTKGDVCDDDIDNDGIPNMFDNCWYTQNPEQGDSDNNCPPLFYETDPKCGDACEAPEITILSPIQDETYPTDTVDLNFTVYDNDGISWMGYRLDSLPMELITGNITLTGLVEGLHRIEVYAEDSGGHIGSSSVLFIIISICGDGIWDDYEWCGQDCYIVTGRTDMNHDCVIDVQDLLLVTSLIMTNNPSGDFNDDGIVSAFDLAIFKYNYGNVIGFCNPADQYLIDQAGSLSVSFSNDPYNIADSVTVIPGYTFKAYIVVDNVQDLRTLEFGLSSPASFVFFGFIFNNPFQLPSVSWDEDKIEAISSEPISEPVIVGWAEYQATQLGQFSIDIIPDSRFGELNWSKHPTEMYKADFLEIHNGGVSVVPDSDGDGVADFEDQCPNTIPGAPVDAIGCPDPPIPNDYDTDGDVDQDDFDLFQACGSGPDIPLNPGCEGKDFDNDNDVDQDDFAVFQLCYSGENNLADPSCAD